MSGSSKKTKDAKPIHFFRVILGHVEKLPLPKKFVREFGNDRSNSVHISTPSGRVWQIELIKCDAEIWLGNGWKDFADFFSLKHGNLLVFRYEGHSRFYVSMIFDQSTFEVEYPIDTSSSSEDANHDVEPQTPEVEEIESDVFVEIIDNISLCQKRVNKAPLPPFSRSKRIRTRLSSETQGTYNVNKSKGANGELKFKISRKSEGKISIPPAEGAGSSSEDANHDVELQTPKVEEIESDDSVEIIDNISLWQKRVNKTPLPCFSPNKRMRTRLSSEIQGTCNVSKSRDANSESKFEIARKSEGKISTPPAKELARAKSSALRSRSSDEARRKMLNATALSKASNFGSENPFFLVVMRRSYVLRGANLSIPVAFAKTYFTRKQNDLILRDSDGKTWSANCKINGNIAMAYFRHGWDEFALHHKLKVGDICAFELLEGLEISFRVTIFRVAENANDHITAGKLKEVMQTETPVWHASEKLSMKETTRVFQRLSRFWSNHPVFVIVITTSFLWKVFPTVPASFCKEYLKCIPRDATLKCKGKLWSVKLCTRSARPAQFGAGWWEFASENKLQAGDICVFEMINRTNIVLKVSIF